MRLDFIKTPKGLHWRVGFLCYSNVGICGYLELGRLRYVWVGGHAKFEWNQHEPR